jgi:hypothetical protein
VQTQLGANVERKSSASVGSNSFVARLGFGPVVLLVGYFFALLLHGARYGGDDPARYQAAAELAHGRWPTSKYSLIQPLVMAPVYRLASMTGSPQQATMMFFGVFSTTIALLLLANLIRRHRSARFVEIMLGAMCCSMLSSYALGANAEVLSALWLSVGLASGLNGNTKWGRHVGWVVAVLATANIPTMVAGAGLFGLWLAWRRKQWRFLLFPMFCALTVIAESSFAVGHFAIGKYASEGWSSDLLPFGHLKSFQHPLFFGLLGILFSFGRGLIFYMPTLFIRHKQSDDPISEWAGGLRVFVCALIPVYAKWWGWNAGITFGPRFFMLAVIPGAFAVASVLTSAQASRLHRNVTITAVALSAWVGVCGVTWDITTVVRDMAVRDQFRYEPLAWFFPHYSTIFSPLWEFPAIDAKAVLFLAFSLVSVVRMCGQQLREEAARVGERSRAFWRS